MSKTLTINGVTLDKRKLLAFISENKKIRAIKYVKVSTRLGLKESKDIVDNLEHNPYHYANDTITVSGNNEDSGFVTSPSRRGNHIIKDTKSNTKTIIIAVLLVVIGLLLYLLGLK